MTAANNRLIAHELLLHCMRKSSALSNELIVSSHNRQRDAQCLSAFIPSRTALTIVDDVRQVQEEFAVAERGRECNSSSQARQQLNI